jgi:nucleoid-associated protein YgaU
MGLEKITILNTDTATNIRALFNPKEYTISKTTSWATYDEQGKDFADAHFTVGGRRELSLELFFDTYESKQNVKDYVKSIEKLMLIDVEQHRPPILLITWGKNALNFKCVLEQMQQRYTMFLNDGTPVRAIINATFKEIDPDQQGSLTSDGEKQSPDHTKIRIFKDGDSLPNMAYLEYEDCTKWKILANANNILDPLNIPAGTEIIVPPIVE